MKNIFLCSAILLLSLPLFAQPVFSESNLPSLGGIYRYVQADTTGVTAGPAGANVVWDFSSWNLINDTNTFYILPPAATPFGTTFGASDYAERTADEYKYFSHDASGLFLDGVSLPTIGAVKFDSAVTLATFPFAFGDSVTDRVTAQFTYLIFTAYRRGTATSVADGYGTLILPNGTYTDVLRVRTIEMSTDSVSAALKNQSNSVSFSWYAPDWDYPVLTMLTFESSGFISASSRVVQFLSTTSTGLEEDMGVGFRVYPNPASGLLRVEFEAGLASEAVLSVFDLAGKELRREQLPAMAGKTVIGLEGLSPGVYLIRLEVNGKSAIRRVMIRK
jgi:hypothetical protein